MRLHESHEEGGFGVSHNTITRHAASYTTNARFVAFMGTFARPAQQVWLPGNDIQDPTTWDATPQYGHPVRCPYWGRCSARPDTRYGLNMA